MSAIELKRRQRKRRRARMKRTAGLLLAIIGIIFAAILLCGTGYGRGTPKYEYHTYDRLWDFVKLCPVNMDRWEYIYEIMELNAMDDMTVMPDRLYMVPIYSK